MTSIFGSYTTCNYILSIHYTKCIIYNFFWSSKTLFVVGLHLEIGVCLDQIGLHLETPKDSMFLIVGNYSWRGNKWSILIQHSAQTCVTSWKGINHSVNRSPGSNHAISRTIRCLIQAIGSHPESNTGPQNPIKETQPETSSKYQIHSTSIHIYNDFE